MSWRNLGIKGRIFCLFCLFSFSPSSDDFCHISHNHITHTMHSTRNYHSISLSSINAPVAMPSLATGSRIPAPQCASVARVPIATAQSIPRPVNTLPVARRHLPTDQRSRPSTTVDNLASSLAAMSISKPDNQAIAPPSAPKPKSSLPCLADSCKKLASDRIQARRQQVIANLEAPKKRSTAPVSIRQSSPIPSRAVSPAVVTPASIPSSPSMPSGVAEPAIITPVSILKSPSMPSRVIPPPSARDRRASTRVSVWMPRGWQAFRGRAPYCENVSPRHWKTTPAEADVDPGRRRIVRFADKLVQSTKTFRPWYNKTWPPPAKSTDETTEEEDDAAIRAMDNPPQAAANTNPLPSG